MNFIPCRVEEANGSLSVRLTDQLSFPVPAARAAQYQSHRQNGKLLLGLRPEHITEAHQHLEPGEVPFDANLDVTEPMGMETLVYFPVNGTQVCGRVNPNAGARDGAPLPPRRQPQQHAPDRRGQRPGHLSRIATATATSCPRSRGPTPGALPLPLPGLASP